MRKHNTQGSLVDVFKKVHQNIEVVDSLQSYPHVMKVGPQWVYSHGLAPLRPLSIELSNLQLVDQLAERVESLKYFRFGIHARQGDVRDKPLSYGRSRWLPFSLYELLFRKLAETTTGEDVFFASDSAELLSLATRHLPQCTIEDDILDGEFKDAQKIWLIISQLARCETLLTAPGVAFGLLAKLHPPAYHSTHWTTPTEYLGLANLHEEYIDAWRAAVDTAKPMNSTSPLSRSRNHLSTYLRSLIHKTVNGGSLPIKRVADERVFVNGMLVPEHSVHSDFVPRGMEAYRFD